MTMSSRENIEKEWQWSAEEELKLFLALDGLKPVGINKHFYMLSIAERLSKSLNREVSVEAIWQHLGSMYNLQMLDDMEPLPFPNETIDFYLPENEYSSLMSRKQLENEEKKSDVKEKTIINNNKNLSTQQKELEKKVTAKLQQEIPKRSTPKRTRGSMSLESPSTTPPPTLMPNIKRRRI